LEIRCLRSERIRVVVVLFFLRFDSDSDSDFDFGLVFNSLLASWGGVDERVRIDRYVMT